ncbi:MAG: HlyD family efflux transporter periplasmic adaptor subunit [Patescibacteria group bacterium]
MNTEQKEKTGVFKKPWVQSLIAVVVIFGALGGFLYWQSAANTIAIDDSYLDAPIANIAPSAPGALNQLFVKEGDRIAASSPVAVVGSETLYAKEGGIIASAPNVVGSYFAPGQTVVSVIADQKMRVIGSIDETKGLSRIAPGQKVTFTVDAFSGKTYQGVVDEVSPASSDTGIAFSISDKRPVKKFDVYMRFDASAYPELKSGMSAKARIHLK